MITRIIRNEGTQRAAIVDIDMSHDEAMELIRTTELKGNLLERISCKKRWFSRTPNHKWDVVIIDCGIKNNFIRQLNALGCNVTMVPHNATVEEVMAFRPNGVLISNGPGNPADQTAAIELVRNLRGKLPIFGLGLGMQIIALAYGARVEKMKYGHRGSNHPIKNHLTGEIEIAVQNHGYVVVPATGQDIEVTHTNLLDQTIEGLECQKDRLLAAQFDPTAVTGDCHDLFKKFVKLMEER
jgi:carbamoyl-phosphate synthase small subunit